MVVFVGGCGSDDEGSAPTPDAPLPVDVLLSADACQAAYSDGSFSPDGENSERVLQIVAHQDDDLLFMSPDVARSISAGERIRTIFVTAGDAGRARDYWSGREAGSHAAYAAMAEVPNCWMTTSETVAGHTLSVDVLTARPNLSVLFLRLPDGWGGEGSSRYNNESLQKLWLGQIAAIHAVDQSNQYTREELLATLTELMTTFGPTTVRIQDYTDRYGGDHSDHHHAGLFGNEADHRYLREHMSVAYRGYNIQTEVANLSDVEAERKSEVFYTYARYDARLCALPGCLEPSYDLWMHRQYTVQP